MQKESPASLRAVECEFRVSSTAKAIDGIPVRPWAEVWSVSLRSSEILLVTESLLKLPLRRDPPLNVCVFAVSEHGLHFGLADGRFEAILNGRETAETLCEAGDRITISNGIVFEVLRGPRKSGGSPQRLKRPFAERGDPPPLEIREIAADSPERPPAAVAPARKPRVGPLITYDSVKLQGGAVSDDFMMGTGTSTTIYRPAGTRSVPRPLPPTAPAKRRTNRRVAGALFILFLLWWVTKA